MNACRSWQLRLPDYVLDALSSSATRPLEDHLHQCAACAAAAADLRQRRQQMDATLDKFFSDAEPSPTFGARVLAAAEAAPPATGWQPAWASALAGVALVVVAVVLLQPFQRRWEMRSAPVMASPSLSQWRAPTDGLLRPRPSELLNSGPRLGEFYFPLDSLSVLPTPEDGGTRNEG